MPATAMSALNTGHRVTAGAGKVVGNPAGAYVSNIRTVSGTVSIDLLEFDATVANKFVQAWTFQAPAAQTITTA
jgi:hypothetical protein